MRWGTLAVLLAAAPALAQQPMRMTATFPAPNAIMDGRSTRFSVMFDGPVDHRASRLFIEHDGVVVETLRPRLNSEPNTLYSNGQRLAPGDYMLRWDVRSARGDSAMTGSIPFHVAGPKG